MDRCRAPIVKGTKVGTAQLRFPTAGSSNTRWKQAPTSHEMGVVGVVAMIQNYLFGWLT